MNRLNLLAGFFGVTFGVAFTGAELNQYDTIHQMLLLNNFEPYLIMASAMATALPILWILERKRFVTAIGGPISLRRWPIQRTHLTGGVIFGAGWAVTGACPATASTTLGSGSLMGIVLIVGMLIGTRLRDMQVQRAADPGGSIASAVDPARA